MSEERTVNTIYPIHTCLFTALQFHGRELLSLGMSNKWLWFENHFNMSFPEFIKKYQQSNVAVAFEIEYIQPFDFFDAKTFDVSISKVRLRQKDSVFEFHHEFTANNIIFARVALYWRILMLSGDDALTAHPGPLGKELIQLFYLRKSIRLGLFVQYLNSSVKLKPKASLLQRITLILRFFVISVRLRINGVLLSCRRWPPLGANN